MTAPLDLDAIEQAPVTGGGRLPRQVTISERQRDQLMAEVRRLRAAQEHGEEYQMDRAVLQDAMQREKASKERGPLRERGDAPMPMRKKPNYEWWAWMLAATFLGVTLCSSMLDVLIAALALACAEMAADAQRAPTPEPEAER